MIKTAILAFAGIHASRPRQSPPVRQHSDAVHDAVNREHAIFAGSELVARRSVRLSEAMASDPTNRTRIRKGVADMRTIMAEVARRADR